MNLKRAIEIIEGGAWLSSIRFITADVNKGTGGKVIELGKCRILRNRVSDSASEFKTAAPINPNHHFHFTRNLQLPNNQVRKVHPILITHLNQEAVI